MSEKRKTRRQKIKSGDKKNSKYANKIKDRVTEARKAGLPSDAPWPLIWSAQQESEE